MSNDRSPTIAPPLAPSARSAAPTVVVLSSGGVSSAGPATASKYRRRPSASSSGSANGRGLDVATPSRRPARRSASSAAPMPGVTIVSVSEAVAYRARYPAASAATASDSGSSPRSSANAYGSGGPMQRYSSAGGRAGRPLATSAALMEPVIAARESASTPSRSNSTTPLPVPVIASRRTRAARTTGARRGPCRTSAAARAGRTRDEPVHEPVAVGHDVEALRLARDAEHRLATARSAAHVDRRQLEPPR